MQSENIQREWAGRRATAASTRSEGRPRATASAFDRARGWLRPASQLGTCGRCAGLREGQLQAKVAVYAERRPVIALSAHTPRALCCSRQQALHSRRLRGLRVDRPCARGLPSPLDHARCSTRAARPKGRSAVASTPSELDVPPARSWWPPASSWWRTPCILVVAAAAPSSRRRREQVAAQELAAMLLARGSDRCPRLPAEHPSFDSGGSQQGPLLAVPRSPSSSARVTAASAAACSARHREQRRGEGRSYGT